MLLVVKLKYKNNKMCSLVFPLADKALIDEYRYYSHQLDKKTRDIIYGFITYPGRPTRYRSDQNNKTEMFLSKLI